MPEPLQLPNGLQYMRDFIHQCDADDLLDFIDAQVWDTGLRRRVQHYGWRYDYKASQVKSGGYIGPLPDVFETISVTINERLGGLAKFDQVIINEYAPGQGISAHVDCLPCFGPVVAAVSLGSTCEMVFQNLASKERLSIVLEPLSLLVMAGEARQAWSHAIPARRSDIVCGERLARSRRVSLTFRTKT